MEKRIKVVITCSGSKRLQNNFCQNPHYKVKELNQITLPKMKALDLYSKKIYGELKEVFGYENVYILSAGFGLVRGDIEIPSYNLTFSKKAPKENWISPEERAEYGSICDSIGEFDELHLFLSREYLKYWNLAFKYRVLNDNPNAKIIVHDRNIENITKRTNWHYKSAKNFISLYKNNCKK